MGSRTIDGFDSVGRKAPPCASRSRAPRAYSSADFFFRVTKKKGNASFIDFLSRYHDISSRPANKWEEKKDEEEAQLTSSIQPMRIRGFFGSVPPWCLGGSACACGVTCILLSFQGNSILIGIGSDASAQLWRCRHISFAFSFSLPSPHWKQKTPIRRDLAYIIHARSMLFTVSSVFLFPHFVCVPVFYYQMIIAQWLLLSASNPMIHRHTGFRCGPLECGPGCPVCCIHPRAPIPPPPLWCFIHFLHTGWK